MISVVPMDIERISHDPARQAATEKLNDEVLITPDARPRHQTALGQD